MLDDYYYVEYARKQELSAQFWIWIGTILFKLIFEVENTDSYQLSHRFISEYNICFSLWTHHRFATQDTGSCAERDNWEVSSFVFETRT